ncbi:hypothetical protein AMS68_005069 [Peltaster fructicola]|uniref:Uncharacterized protein n=1 Tax=Peltaster fructicola TaxID=286661 RepID=A0A6H0XXQ8_9PEZI|nr:hypothetical protein AMS68_005069 [Peltaster fructicola]
MEVLVEKPGTEKAVTGHLPAGSMYTITESDSYSVDVTASVSVEAGFFDPFSASASVSVDERYSRMTSHGETINVDCDDGQDGIIYAYPPFTMYAGLCRSDDNNEIDVWVPAVGHTNYRATCLGCD